MLRTMRAHRIVTSQQPAELCEVAVPEPGPGEVLIKVGGAGLCHSDLHMMHWPSGHGLPFTIGHETAGWVESVGAGGARRSTRASRSSSTAPGGVATAAAARPTSSSTART